MDVWKLLETVLRIREQTGPSADWTKRIRNAGKKLLLCYLEISQGSTAYDKAVMNAAVDRLCQSFEAGDMSAKYFRFVRRAAADIDDVAEYGAISESRIPHWGKRRNPLFRPVSEEVRGDMENVIGLSFAVLDAMREAGYGFHMIRVCQSVALSRLIWYFEDHGSTRYSAEVIASYLDGIRMPDRLSPDWTLWSHIRTAALHVSSMHDHGRLHEPAFDGALRRMMKGPFSEVLREFGEWAVSDGGLGAGTAKTYATSIARFLEALYDAGVYDLAGLTRDDVRAALEVVDEGKDPSTICNTRVALRALARFSERSHPEIPDIAQWLGRAPVSRRKMPVPGYPREAADAMVASIDESTPAGKRDRAIITLGKNMGVRGCDIRTLKLSDLDWRNSTIAVAQQKTNRTILLPLDKETGEALATYILESRRSGGGDVLFLTAVGKVGPLSRKRLHGIVERRARPVVGDSFGGLHGPHALRRGLGKSMIEGGVALEDAAEVLGHASTDSTDPYVAIATERLRVCATGLDMVPTGKIGWLR